ncbi:hypothetical protein PR048_011400 [Dryococelus australis]|uniref:Uncharacterized protein n=1 Tax=Dryococelus australis TaxID=614101 RepID=A0ABQ9HM28_9NEOP|nr:hypothetical protein PR048_011400 [Dryococelus australis]
MSVSWKLVYFLAVQAVRVTFTTADGKTRDVCSHDHDKFTAGIGRRGFLKLDKNFSLDIVNLLVPKDYKQCQTINDSCADFAGVIDRLQKQISKCLSERVRDSLRTSVMYCQTVIGSSIITEGVRRANVIPAQTSIPPPRYAQTSCTAQHLTCADHLLHTLYILEYGLKQFLVSLVDRKWDHFSALHSVCYWLPPSWMLSAADSPRPLFKCRMMWVLLSLSFGHHVGFFIVCLSVLASSCSMYLNVDMLWESWEVDGRLHLIKIVYGKRFKKPHGAANRRPLDHRTGALANENFLIAQQQMFMCHPSGQKIILAIVMYRRLQLLRTLNPENELVFLHKEFLLMYAHDDLRYTCKKLPAYLQKDGDNRNFQPCKECFEGCTTYVLDTPYSFSWCKVYVAQQQPPPTPPPSSKTPHSDKHEQFCRPGDSRPHAADHTAAPTQHQHLSDMRRLASSTLGLNADHFRHQRQLTDIGRKLLPSHRQHDLRSTR